MFKVKFISFSEIIVSQLDAPFSAARSAALFGCAAAVSIYHHHLGARVPEPQSAVPEPQSALPESPLP